MLGVLPLAALATADRDSADQLVSRDLCVSRHRLVQDEWCQFNCNTAMPNCPADTCECEGSIAMTRVPAHNDDSPPNGHAGERRDATPAHETAAAKRAPSAPVHNASLANRSSAEAPSPEVLRTADGKHVKSLTTDNKKEWHSASGRRNAGINGDMVLFGSNDGKLPSLAAQIVDKFYSLCKSAHGSDCSLTQRAQISSEQLQLHVSDEPPRDSAADDGAIRPISVSDDAVTVGGITDGVLTPIPPADA